MVSYGRSPITPWSRDRRSPASRSTTSIRGVSRSYAALDSVQNAARSNVSGRSNRSSRAVTRRDPRHAIRARLAVGAGDEVPDAGLEDEAEWLEDPIDGLVAAVIGDLDALAFPDRLGQRPEEGHGLVGVIPGGRVEVEPLDEARCPRPELDRQRRQDLQPGRRDDRPEAELGGRAGQPRQEQRLGLVGGHPGEPRPVAVDEADAAVRSAIGVDRDAGRAQRIDVAVDRPDRDLELLGELRGGLAAARLEEQQERDESGRTHPDAG